MVYTEDPIYLNLLKLDKKKKKVTKKQPSRKCIKCNCILKTMTKKKDWEDRKYCKKCWKEKKEVEEYLNHFN